jgi:hypothetical protein
VHAAFVPPLVKSAQDGQMQTPDYRRRLFENQTAKKATNDE